MNSASGNDQDQRFGKSWFLADLVRCESYLQASGLTPICDSSVGALIINSICRLKDRPEVSDNLGVLDRVRTLGMTEIASEVEQDPSLVWITCGSAITGLPLRQKLVRAVMTDGMVVGVANASPFNAGYAGLILYEWNCEEMARNLSPGRKIVRFYGGVLRSAAVL